MNRVKLSSSERSAKSRCSYCHEALGSRPCVSCRLCDTKLHIDCFHQLERCPSLGCQADFDNPPEDGLDQPSWPKSHERGREQRLALAFGSLAALFLISVLLLVLIGGKSMDALFGFLIAGVYVVLPVALALLFYFFSVKSRKSYQCPECGEGIEVEYLDASRCSTCGAAIVRKDS